MKLNFTSLQYFQKTAELEHLTKAAEELHIAQPALSRTIRGLEQELNVTLFEHQGRNIRLTRDGHILLKHAQNFLKELCPSEVKRYFRLLPFMEQTQVASQIYTVHLSIWPSM